MRSRPTASEHVLLRLLDAQLARKSFADYAAHRLDAWDNHLQQRMLEKFPSGFWCLAVHLGRIDIENEEFICALRDNNADVSHAHLINILVELLPANIQLNRGGIERLMLLLSESVHNVGDIATKVAGALKLCHEAHVLSAANYWDIIEVVTHESHLNGGKILETIVTLQNTGLLSVAALNTILNAYRNRDHNTINNIEAIPNILAALPANDFKHHPADAKGSDTPAYSTILQHLSPLLFTHGRQIYDAMRPLLQRLNNIHEQNLQKYRKWVWATGETEFCCRVMTTPPRFPNFAPREVVLEILEIVTKSTNSSSSSTAFMCTNLYGGTAAASAGAMATAATAGMAATAATAGPSTTATAAGTTTAAAAEESTPANTRPALTTNCRP